LTHNEWVTCSLSEGVLRIVLTDGPEKAFIPGLQVSAALQPGQPLLSILKLGPAGVGVLPEVEEFLATLCG
jgi:hypothetical protein